MQCSTCDSMICVCVCVCLSLSLSIMYKVDVPNSNTTIIEIPLFEWYVIRCGSKNGHQKDLCFEEEIGLHAPRGGQCVKKIRI
jgi:hypothetical protein